MITATSPLVAELPWLFDLYRDKVISDIQLQLAFKIQFEGTEAHFSSTGFPTKGTNQKELELIWDSFGHNRLEVTILPDGRVRWSYCYRRLKFEDGTKIPVKELPKVFWVYLEIFKSAMAW